MTRPTSTSPVTSPVSSPSPWPDPGDDPVRGGGVQLGEHGRAALAAAAAGHCVFPVRPGDKVPVVRGWERLATRDSARITSWWARVATRNIGIATGPSGLLVIDLDTAHAEPAPPPWAGARDGAEVLARLAAASGETWPGPTWTVATPTGGRHLYFRAPAGVELRNTAGLLGWRIDTRAGGGYVVGAGSARPDGGYTVVDHSPVAALPTWLLTALTPPAPPPPATQAPRPVVDLPVGSGRVGAYVAAALTGESTAVAAARVGTRHTTLLSAARQLGQLVGADVLTAAAARDALTAAARGYLGVSGYTTEQVDRDITDGLAYGARLPRTLNALTEQS